MMKQIVFVFVLAFLFYSCEEEESPRERAEKQAAKDEGIIKQYLEDNSLDAMKDPSGLYYFIEEPGAGDFPEVTDSVVVKYKGYLTDGTIFDQTGDKEVTFLLRDLILGWQIGIPKLQPGGNGTFLLPSALGYGSVSVGIIPSNSVLVFDIELVDIK